MGEGRVDHLAEPAARELSDIGFERLVAAISDAPDGIDEWAVSRVSDDHGGGPAFVALRWDIVQRRKPTWDTLQPKQLEALQALADGMRQNQIDSHDRFYRTLRGAAARLGASTPYQTLAIAVRLGLVEISQNYVLGPAFKAQRKIIVNDKELPPGLHEVIEGVCNGMSVKEIAAKRGVPIETVKSQMKVLRKAYGARSVHHLSALAVRHGHVV